ncbi:hypothetical protein V6Z11_A08G213200 [Gossypium hirsutum]
MEGTEPGLGLTEAVHEGVGCGAPKKPRVFVAKEFWGGRAKMGHYTTYFGLFWLPNYGLLICIMLIVG